MVKIQLNKSFRTVLIVIATVFLLIPLFMLYRTLMIPKFSEENTPVYSYTNKNNVNYTVFLKPNVLYDRESLEEGGTYISEFVDRIQTNFSYTYTGDKVADIIGNYEVVAEVEGYTIDQKEEHHSIWKRSFNLLPQKNINIKDKTINISENISFRLEDYTNFAKQVIDSSKVTSPVRLIVKMNIITEASTDKGVVKEENYPSMIIPLNTGYFSISGNLQEERPGVIEEPIREALPVSRGTVTIQGLMAGILLITLLVLVLFTKARQPRDPMEKKLKQIFKKYGDRLVALNSEIAATCERYSEVYSIDDLVRIADEIGKPIMYRYRPNYKDISTFYVSHENQIYILDIHKVLTEPKYLMKKLLKRKSNKNEMTVTKFSDSQPEGFEESN